MNTLLTIRNISALVALLITTNFCLGQEYVTILNTHHSVSGPTSSPGLLAPASELIQESLLDLTIPVFQGDSLTVITGTQTETIWGGVADNQTLEGYTSIILKAGVNWQYHPKRKWLFVALPKTSGTTLNFSKNSLQLGGVAVHTWTKTTRLKYKAGLFFMNEFFGPFFVPILGMYWKPTEKLSINMSLPISGDLRYVINKKWEAGITFQAYVRSFLRNYSYQTDQYLMKISNEPFIYGQYNFTDRWGLQLKLGYPVGRKFELYDINDKAGGGIMFTRFDDQRTVVNPQLPASPIAQLKLVFRYPTGE